MNIVTVTASKSYSIKIGAGLLRTLGQEAAALGRAEKILLVSDSNVYPLYGPAAEDSLVNSGFSVSRFVFSAGEEQKNGGTYLSLLSTLAEAGLTRTDLVVALGGGVVGDLAGFAAATYLRGIRFIQVPTTLLAAVDSSVGGKTAIDLPAGKNLAGTFWQPSLVLCDTDTLATLPEAVFRDGCAEVIKYAVLYDPDLFKLLSRDGIAFDQEVVITRCIQWKRDVVAEDEFDTGSRRKLNLGHTIGHGVETRSNFGLSHGKAVAIGLAIVCRAAVSKGLCREEDSAKITGLLDAFGLPIETGFPAEEIYHYTLSDKKRTGSTISLIIPREIGRCEILPFPVTELLAFIKEGL